MGWAKSIVTGLSSEALDLTLHEIAANASTLADRLAGLVQPLHADSGTQGAARLKHWHTQVAKGEDDLFARRLAYAGLDVQRAQQLLGPAAWMGDLPAWAETLRAILTAPAATTNPVLDPAAPLPFEEILLPFVNHARQHVQAANRLEDRLTLAAQTALERHLLQTLTAIAARPLFLEFCVFRSAQPADSYRAFVHQMAGAGLTTFFREYSALARLLCLRTELWIEAVIEFLTRLATDWPDLCQTFGLNTDPSRPALPIATLQAGLSDPHCGGRTVWALTFANGLRVVYKPKPLGLEVAFNQLLAWMNQQGLENEFQPVKVLARSTHGWAAYVERSALESEGEAARHYYRRAGGLLSLFYILRATDFHDENVIASGEYPIAIDHETLLRPALRDSDAAGLDITSATKDLLLLNSSFLPGIQLHLDGHWHLTGSFGQAIHTVQDVLDWQAINRDDMTFERRPPSQRVIASQVLAPPEHYSADIEEGFRQMHQFLIQQRDQLLDHGSASPLFTFAGQLARYVFRDTAFYLRLLNTALEPKYLRAGIDRSLYFDVLSYPLLSMQSSAEFWELAASEQLAMERGDIPYFCFRTDSTALITETGALLPNFFASTGSEAVRNCLQQLSEADLDRYLGFIRLPFQVVQQSAQSHTQNDTKVSADDTDFITDRGFVAEAARLAQLIRDGALRSAEGSLGWLGPKTKPNSDHSYLWPLGYDLYGGVTGIALFLAAFSRITGDETYRVLALSALNPLRHVVANAESGRKLAHRIGLGFTGLGGLLYALNLIGQLLDDPSLLEMAERVADLIELDAIQNDTAHDVLTGQAGALLGVLSLYETQADLDALSKALACGDALLAARTESNAGPRAWRTVKAKLFGGLSHGAAGIAYALARLSAATGREEFLAAAQEGWAYEATLFSATEGNWLDLRADHPHYNTSWCHGAPGIGLAALGSLPAYIDNALIDIALQTTERQPWLGLDDSLCCGNFGRLELSLVAAQKLNRHQLLSAARSRAAGLVSYAHRARGYTLFAGPAANLASPSFFNGVAGIGYTLLRLAYPHLLPCVLLAEPGQWAAAQVAQPQINNYATS